MATGPTSRRLREVIVRGARLRYAARGAVYLVIGGLAVTAALGGGRATGTGGAFRFLLAQPFGKGLLAVAALGLLLYAAWRVLAGVGDQEGRAGGWRSALARAGHLASGLANLGLAALAVAVAFPAAVPWGGGHGGGADAWTSAVMRGPLGR